MLSRCCPLIVACFLLSVHLLVEAIEVEVKHVISVVQVRIVLKIWVLTLIVWLGEAAMGMTITSEIF